MITAESIMSEHVEVIYGDMRIRDVAHLLLRDRVSGFPVVDQKIGLVGIITITDLFKMIHRASGNGKPADFRKEIARFQDTKVSEVMSKGVVSVERTTTMKEIIDLLEKKGIHTFPVMEKGKLIGIIGRHDILNAIFSIPPEKK